MSWPSLPSTPACAAMSVLYMRMNGCASSAMENTWPSLLPAFQIGAGKSASVTP